MRTLIGWSCLSYGHGLSQAVSGTSGTGGRTDFQHFSITKVIDSGSPDLAIYCASGKHMMRSCCIGQLGGRYQR